MNINSLINWQNGLELTSDTFITLEDNINRRVKTTAQIMGHSIVGIIPRSRFECEATFVNKNVEISRLSCRALLPNGRLIDVDEAVTLPMPLLYGSEYYLTVKEEKKIEASSERNVPILSPQYSYSITTLDDIEQSTDMFPLIKFNVNDGLFNIDASYIPAYVQMDSSELFGNYITTFAELLSQIAEHKNFESGEGQRSFTRYAYLLRKYKPNHRVEAFADLLQEIALAAEYYIMLPNKSATEVDMEYSIYDIQRWLQFVENYLKGAISVLDQVVLIDTSIDMERLKAEVKRELYDEIYNLIYSKLSEQMNGELRDGVEQVVTTNIVEHINTEIRKILKDELHIEISDDLQGVLYSKLYDALYEALYIKPQEVKDIIPLM